jgi:DNA transposition AAA+ family ATPase
MKESQMIEADRVRAELNGLLSSRPDLSATHIAQQTTLSPSTVRSFAAGRTPGGRHVTTELGRVLDQARTGEILNPSPATVKLPDEQSTKRLPKAAAAFYETQSVRRVAEVLDFCTENCAIGIITGDFGTGKTEAVKAWLRKPGQVENLLFEFHEFSAANKVETVRMLCDACGIATFVANQNAGRAFQSLCEHLRNKPCLLIFDQCEMLRPRVCQVIRQIWDRTNDAGVGVVMLAAPIMLSRMLSSKMPDLAALTSRVGIWAALTGLTKSEMAAIVKQEGITDMDDLAFDFLYKAIGGSMRRLMRSLALLKARHAGKRITEKTIVGISAHLFGLAIREEA